jgi:hypothetical protein
MRYASRSKNVPGTRRPDIHPQDKLFRFASLCHAFLHALCIAAVIVVLGVSLPSAFLGVLCVKSLNPDEGKMPEA